MYRLFCGVVVFSVGVLEGTFFGGMFHSFVIAGLIWIQMIGSTIPLFARGKPLFTVMNSSNPFLVEFVEDFDE